MAEKQPTICLTFDFDAVSIWAGTFGFTSPSPASRGEFGGRVAVPRILDILAREGVQATFFVPGITVEAWPELCRRMLADGHEIAHHGHHHVSPVQLDEAAEREQLDRGLQAMAEHLDDHRPRGYRSPACDLSPNSTRLLAEYGFAYESSMSGRDFELYRCRTGDRLDPDGTWAPGPEIDLVEIPFSWSLDDFPQMEFVVSPIGLVLEGLKDPERVERMWLADLDFMVEEVPGGVYTMTYHPQVIGRGARIRILERMIARGMGLGARFSTCSDAAQAWSGEYPFGTDSGPSFVTFAA